MYINKSVLWYNVINSAPRHDISAQCSTTMVMRKKSVQMQKHIYGRVSVLLKGHSAKCKCNVISISVTVRVRKCECEIQISIERLIWMMTW